MVNKELAARMKKGRRKNIPAVTRDVKQTAPVPVPDHVAPNPTTRKVITTAGEGFTFANKGGFRAFENRGKAEPQPKFTNWGSPFSFGSMR